MYKNDNDKINLDYFINIGLYLGNRLENRKVWLYNFILGSRGFWEILNIKELLKSLEILGPIVIFLIKKGGTILIVNKKMSIESKFLGKLFSIEPFNEIVYLYLDNWLDGAFTNFFNFKLLNLRQLPNILFLVDFSNSSNILDEAYYLRIPVIALVDSRQHIDNIFKNIAFPLPANNSIKSLFFFFNFIKYNILKGLYFFDYSLNKDKFFSSFLKNAIDLKYSIKNKKILNFFLFLNLRKKKKCNFFFNKIVHRKQVLGDSFLLKKKFNNKKLTKINGNAVFGLGYIRRYRGVIKSFLFRLNEKFSKHTYKKKDYYKNKNIKPFSSHLKFYLELQKTKKEFKNNFLGIETNIKQLYIYNNNNNNKYSNNNKYYNNNKYLNNNNKYPIKNNNNKYPINNNNNKYPIKNNNNKYPINNNNKYPIKNNNKYPIKNNNNNYPINNNNKYPRNTEFISKNIKDESLKKEIPKRKPLQNSFIQNVLPKLLKKDALIKDKNNEFKEIKK